MAKCQHKTIKAVFELDLDGVIRVADASGALTFACVVCGAVGVRSLGEANNDDVRVQPEYWAAMLIARIAAGDLPQMTNAEKDGFLRREDSPFVALRSWDAGWIAAEHLIAGEAGDDGWPWDASRPVSGQGEQWLAEQRARDQAVYHAADGAPTSAIDDRFDHGGES